MDYTVMLVKIRVATLNLCSECVLNIEDFFIELELIKNVFVDILFLQEVKPGSLSKIAKIMGMSILEDDIKNETGVLFDEKNLKRVNSYVLCEKVTEKKVFVSSVHLNDMPSVVHHLNNLPYEGLSADIPIDDIISLSRKNRLPEVEKLLKKFDTTKIEIAIIGGDFNEPSHFDYPELKLPVSAIFQDNGFLDAYRSCYVKKKGYTWPSGVYYKNHPHQRIDYIYVKNMDVVKTILTETPISDHKIVYSELLL